MKHFAIQSYMLSRCFGQSVPLPQPTVMCSWCGRMRLPNNCWVMDEGVNHPFGLSHTACPDCGKQVMRAIRRDLTELND